MRQILIVEDDLAIAQMYRFKLEQYQYHVMTATNGIEGLETAKTYQPQLILVDLNMPVMNGAEMLSRLRSQTWGANMRVIILTNISRSEAPAHLRLLRVDRYIVKAHCTPTQLAETVAEILPAIAAKPRIAASHM